MANRIIAPISQTPISQNGIQTTSFRQWTQAITERATIIGSGSPEGVVTATQGALYMDEDATTGSILYIKKEGSGANGWVLV